MGISIRVEDAHETEPQQGSIGSDRDVTTFGLTIDAFAPATDCRRGHRGGREPGPRRRAAASGWWPWAFGGSGTAHRGGRSSRRPLVACRNPAEGRGDRVANANRQQSDKYKRLFFRKPVIQRSITAASGHAVGDAFPRVETASTGSRKGGWSNRSRVFPNPRRKPPCLQKHACIDT